MSDKKKDTKDEHEDEEDIESKVMPSPVLGDVEDDDEEELTEEERKAKLHAKMHEFKTDRMPKHVKAKKEANREEANEEIDRPDDMTTINFKEYPEYLKEKGMVAPLLLIGLDNNGNLKFTSAIPSKPLSLTQAEVLVEQVSNQIEESINRIKSNIQV